MMDIDPVTKQVSQHNNNILEHQMWPTVVSYENI